MRFVYQIDDELSLELQAPEQAEELFALVDKNRAFIGEHMAWVSRCRTVENMRQFMLRDLQGMATERRWAWMIRYRGQAAGRIGIFVSFPEGREAELNYWLGEEFTGKGIITRAARVITDYAFGTLKLNHVLIGFTSMNPKSGAVAERIGFQHEFTKRQDTLHENEWADVHFWGITAKDWSVHKHPVFRHDLGDGLKLSLTQIYEASARFDLAMRNFEEFIPIFGWANEKFSLEAEVTQIKRLLEHYASGSRIGVTIWQDGQLIGSAAINPDEHSRDVQVGYWLDKAARGKGVITRVVRALMHYSFVIRGMERFFLRAADNNQASRSVAERLGMKQEAIMREENLINGRFANHVLYSLLAREFVPDA